MYKPKVLFPFVEAGMGHIIPMMGVSEMFAKKYGDRCEVMTSYFYKEVGTAAAEEFEHMLVSEVKRHNRFRGYAKVWFFIMDLFRGASIKAIMEWLMPDSYDDSMQYMNTIKPDLVFSTHWATSYYANHLSNAPINIEYCPDVRMDVLWKTGAECIFIPSVKAAKRASQKLIFKNCDIKSVPFVVRPHAYEISRDKVQLRKSLSLPEDVFTVTLADGGYGAGKLREVVEALVKSNTPMNIVAVCGKNEALKEHLLDLKQQTKCEGLVVEGFTDRMLEYIAASDLFVGKSGASSMAEPCFFGVPALITMYATQIEHDNGEYYINEVGSAVKEFNPKKAAEKVVQFAQNPESLASLAQHAQRDAQFNGAEVIADYLFLQLKEKFGLSD